MVVAMDRRPWLAAWHGTVWEIRHGGAWRRLVPRLIPPGGAVLLSAWNPHGRRAGAAANRAGDHRLRQDCRRLGLDHRRIRGRAANGAWIEEGWLIPCPRPIALRLLLRHRQIAAPLLHGDRSHLLWRDGAMTRLRDG